ncbi:MAG: LEA type 2 family protein [Planctomycetota bacterium]|jgi:LEA14-like dessication related protein
MKKIIAMFVMAVLFVVGCGGPKILTPEAALMKFQVKEMAFLRGSGEIALRISNPNPDPLYVEGLRVVVTSQRENLAKGMTPVNEAIPGYSHKDIIVPVSMSNISLMKAAGKMLALKSKIYYNMDVDLTVKEEGGSGSRRTFNIDKGGSIPLVMPKGLNLSNAFQAK